MASRKIAVLIDALLTRTLQGQPLWERTANAGTFVASFPSHSVAIGPAHDRGNNESYRLQIFNSLGELVEDVYPAEIDEYMHNSYDIFRELYEAARMQAMGVDAAVDEILDCLEKGERPF